MCTLMRVIGFSVMALSASCGVGAQAQSLDTQSDRVTTRNNVRLCSVTETCFDKNRKLDDITALQLHLNRAYP
ncbi:hypothetical protein [Pseudomonas sp. 6D_7.1_Bac1]|jgi:hypothetical protein|uniref:hypothetical protein n=1 Tax=Pseudomonas sp. 6D_7.1_Bac1 TaxID=2971615 RepID=UPI0021CA4B34|nr:hypothetical protein [Pseudomonas sp. 6D_7.1_Bac1]MCU1752219.1 hypothetical protein [Pseudomonas sp. 6D_7.1_Bac1]